MTLSLENPRIVEESLAKEQELGHVIGPPRPVIYTFTSTGLA